ncbi:MAG TPA: hypothetical protein VGR38_00480 [Candidatus Polarisedimenticolia bacterium]|nr:hypothetical protein [Candidatus Polarisedimenticolia bacterium]
MALILALGLTLVYAGEAPPQNAPDLGSRLRGVLLGSPGDRLICPGCPQEPALRVDAVTGQATEVPLPYERVNQIATFPDGDRILAATSSEKGRKSQLLVLSAKSMAPLGRVEIPGNGERLVVSTDGYTAFVISHRPERGDDANPETGDWELLSVDLGSSKVAGSYPLAGAAYDLALTNDGGRLLLGLEDKIQTFTTSPLTASWFFRSPGKNRRLMVRPRQGQVYALRGTEIAIFPPEPLPLKEGGKGAEANDDALGVLKPETHMDRFGFSPDGRVAVAAGRAMDVLIVIDAVRARIAGTWPEDSQPVTALLRDADAAEAPKGPRGRLARAPIGFAPPLGAAAPPKAGDPEEPAGMADASRSGKPGPSSPKTGGTRSAPVDPQGSSAPAQASPPGMAPTPAASPPIDEKPLVVSRPPSPLQDLPPEVASLEEVRGEALSGKIFGDPSQIASVILFGPNSLTAVHQQVLPSPDGSFTFKLPPRGKYRILLVGKLGITLVTRPPYQTLDIGDYGFNHVDFRVLGTVPH